eukprot:1191971-Ditylum_brightwellii.AAC.1
MGLLTLSCSLLIREHIIAGSDVAEMTSVTSRPAGSFSVCPELVVWSLTHLDTPSQTTFAVSNIEKAVSHGIWRKHGRICWLCAVPWCLVWKSPRLPLPGVQYSRKCPCAQRSLTQ